MQSVSLMSQQPPLRRSRPTAGDTRGWSGLPQALSLSISLQDLAHDVMTKAEVCGAGGYGVKLTPAMASLGCES